MKTPPVPILTSLLLCFAAACGSQDQTNSAIAEISPRTTPCLAGDDLDGDGIIDRFSIASGTFFQAASPAACRSAGGTPFEVWPNRNATHPLTAQAAPAATMPYPAGGDPPMGLKQDVKNTGVHTKTYVDGLYDCDDFANDLETALEKAGYHATYTEICTAGPPVYWHAVTDVHLEGETYWFDAITGVPVQLDANGNGQVETSTSGKPCAGTSDGAYNIRVWENLKARITELGPPD